MKYFFNKHLKSILSYGMCVVLGISYSLYSPVVSYAATTQEKLDDTNNQISEIKENQTILSNDLDSLNQKLSNTSDDLASVTSQIEDVKISIENYEKEIKEAKKFEEEQYEAMKLRIKYMYENSSNQSLLEVLVKSGNVGEFLTKAEYISKISQYDRDMLTSYQKNKEKLVEDQKKLEENKKDLESMSIKVQNDKKEIENLLEDTNNKFKMSAEELAKAEKQALEYEKQIEAEEIARQEAERRAAEEAAIKAAQEAAARKEAEEREALARKSSEEKEAARKEAEKNNAAQTTSNSMFNGMDLLHAQTINQLYTYTPQDLNMLAAIIYCEAGNQPYEGKLAVGSVVINRINNPRWPNTLTEVLYQPNQFTPVKSGRFALALANGVNQSCTQAALEVLSGKINTNALFFHVYQPGETGGTVIADHIFY